MSSVERTFQDEYVKQPEKRSSFGNHSPFEMPKDISPHSAAVRDLTERNKSSSNLNEEVEALLDDAFPASDPIAVRSGIARIEISKAS